MALSTLPQLKHRQLLYGVSTRLSQENLKDMMYLAGVEQQLQESISSGTDFFTIMEKKGLLDEHNYTHLISLLETIGRIDLIKTLCSDHQATMVIALPPDKFPVTEQLAIMKRAQILHKRELYLHSLQKLDTLCKSTSVHKMMAESRMMHIQSLLEIPETDSIHISKCFDAAIVGDLLRSISLFHRCLYDLTNLLLGGKTQEFECLAVLCRQHWKELHTKMLKDHSQLTDSLRRVDSLEYTRDSPIGQATVQVYQSLRDVFLEILGSPDLFTAAVDTSFNTLVVNGQSYYDLTNYLLPIGKWLLLLLKAIELGYVSSENLQDTVLMVASNHRKLLIDNAKEMAEIFGQDVIDKIMHSIPKTNETTAESFHEHIPKLNGGLYCLLVSTCVVQLVHAMTSKHSQIKPLKSVLSALHKALIVTKGERISYMTKKLVSDVQREALVYKTKCEQLIETLTSGSAQSAGSIRSLLDPKNKFHI